MNVTIGGIARTVEITSFDKLGDVKVCMLTTTADGSVGFQQLNQEVIDTIYASFPVDTSSGEIASFEDGADNVPVRELKLNLEPYQNLNGYDHPWVGGAGKNILRCTVSSQVLQGVSYVIHDDGSAYATGQATATSQLVYGEAPVVAGQSYRLTCGLTTGSSTTFFVRYVVRDANNAAIEISDIGLFIDVGANTDNLLITIPTGGVKISAYLQVANGQSVNVNFYPMVRLASYTDSSWTPYENICPIYPANGKNLLPGATGGTVSGITFTVNEDNSITLNGTANGGLCDCYFVGGENGNYQLSNIPTGRYLLGGGITHTMLFVVKEGGTIVAQANGSNIVTVDIDSTIKYRIFLRANLGETFSNARVYPMLRHAEITDASYVPYEALGITRTGKNLLGITTDGKTESGITIRRNSNGSITVNGTVSSWNVALRYALGEVAVPRYLYKGQTYTLSGFVGYSASTAYAQLIYVGDETGTTYSIVIANGPVTQTMTENAHIQDVYIVFRVGTSFNNVTFNLQLEVGSSATAYEPYTADRYYIDSSTPIYGGTLEVETGVLTMTKGYAVITGSSSETWYWNTGRNAPYVGVSGGIVTDAVTQYNTYVNSDKFKPVSWAAAGSDDNCVAMYYGSSYVLFKNTSVFTDTATAKAWFASNPTQVVYELATPVTYQLTPTQVKTLLGYNNIWTDSGTVEVQYLANIGLYIQKIIGATEDDMVANQNISANKYFFVGEELYYSTSSISAGQTIVVGTNCIKTNLADALNALNS